MINTLLILELLRFETASILDGTNEEVGTCCDQLQLHHTRNPFTASLRPAVSDASRPFRRLSQATVAPNRILALSRPRAPCSTMFPHRNLPCRRPCAFATSRATPSASSTARPSRPKSSPPSDDEVTYKDVRKKRNRESQGWLKVEGFCERARRDNELLESSENAVYCE